MLSLAQAPEIIATRERQVQILHARHDNSGHLGRFKTYQAVAQDFTWPHMRTDIYDCVDTCKTCQMNKDSQHKPYGLLQPIAPANQPWGSVLLDFIVKLPKSNGFDSILVVVCRRTKMAHFIPCKESISAAGTALLFLTNIFKLHGLPDQVISDCGPQFCFKFTTELYKALKIEVSLTTAYHQQANGQVKRENQILEQYLRISMSRLRRVASYQKLSELPGMAASGGSDKLSTRLRAASNLRLRRARRQLR